MLRLVCGLGSVTRSYRPLLAQIGLTYPQYLVMLVLWQDDGQSVNDIAARLSLPGHALSPLLAWMDRAGLLTRTRQAPDRRVVRVRLTPAGRDLEVAAAEVQRSVVCATQLSAVALGELREQLHGVVEDMTAGTSAPARRERSPRHSRPHSTALPGASRVRCLTTVGVDPS